MILVIAKGTITTVCDTFQQSTCIFYLFTLNIICLTAYLCIHLSVYWFSLFLCPTITTMINKEILIFEIYQRIYLSSGAILPEPEEWKRYNDWTKHSKQNLQVQVCCKIFIWLTRYQILSAGRICSSPLTPAKRGFCVNYVCSSSGSHTSDGFDTHRSFALYL